ncbi:DUF6338 family protein [Rothia aerolata]|uniref:Uncharacterized protein n=1 Tax=Rothia aerolata TaxID=1812262 RepID=A0A917IT19_9MICC|nr:DUF6338 family protein [Rothia aerolata]GGH61901.1 hypothetical protein GCM10007359_11560 [Rothia aerolata]
MILGSVASLILFAFLVVPGGAWRFIRNRHVAPVKESALTEFSRIAFYSVIFLVIAALICGWFWVRFFQELPIDGYLDKYAWLHLGFLTTVHVLLATAISCITAYVYFKDKATFTRYSALDWVFVEQKPQGTRPTVVLKLSDGSTAIGSLHYYDVGPETTDKTVVLAPPYLIKRSDEDEGTKFSDGYFLVSFGKIESWRIGFTNVEVK